MSSPANLQLHHRPDLALLTARWLGESGLEQLQAEYGAVLAANVANGTHRLLLDIRRRSAPSAEATNWFRTVWLPSFTQALAPTPVRLAYLISPLRAQQLRADEPAAATLSQATATGQQHSLALFYDEGEAVRWLLSNAPS
jgi:hypothetical protein